MDISGYRYANASAACAHGYLIPAVLRIIEQTESERAPKRLFDLGCGNGWVANEFSKRGYAVVGVDPSCEGIDLARRNFPGSAFHIGSTDEDLSAKYGRFPIVVSLEVIEHVFAPREYARRLFDLVEPGGLAIISTPYHGYFKNLLLAVSGRLDAHFTALWDNGHIKFWSIASLSRLLTEQGFTDIAFSKVGRIPALAKSMIAGARRPA
jgi:2-polyprenyl-6-hydroxyphenyl methylase/3-demethylubiquinone-9 3-methyltransferase